MQVDHHWWKKEGVQYLGELAVMEMVYSNLDNNQVSRDLDDIHCTWAMWQRLVQYAPV